MRLGRGIVARRHGAHATGSVEDTEEKSLSGGGDRALAFELAERVRPGGKALIKQASDVAIEATQGDESGYDAVRRAACAAMLLDLQFLEEGIWREVGAYDSTGIDSSSVNGVYARYDVDVDVDVNVMRPLSVGFVLSSS